MNHLQREIPSPTALVEQGKIHAVAGEHTLALIYYRAAMQMTPGDDDQSRLLSRYFAECALESFERMGDFESIFAYCEQALGHYTTHPPAGLVAWMDLASLHQRQGVVHFKFGAVDSAMASLNNAAALCRDHGFALPVVDTLRKWLLSKLHVDNRRLEEMLTQHGYYSVTRQTIDPARAAPLPSEVLETFQPGRIMS